MPAPKIPRKPIPKFTKAELNKDERGDDRHSKNGIRTLKKLPRNFQH